jgi:hypothetical protein
MLIAELHGKIVPEALSSEDYLTSAVFGHLRYVPPGPFWEALLEAARSLPVEGTELSARATLEQAAGRKISEYENLSVIFWPQHPQGEPDLFLLFQARDARAIAVCVEVKLDAGKSGSGENDQLVRYLRLCDTIERLSPAVPRGCLTGVVYLTAQDSRSVLLESLTIYGDSVGSRSRLFQLEWQDVLETARQCSGLKGAQTSLILHDVSEFLARRGLEHFRGMTLPKDFPAFDLTDGLLFSGASLFSNPDVPDDIELIRGGWVHGN